VQVRCGVAAREVIKVTAQRWENRARRAIRFRGPGNELSFRRIRVTGGFQCFPGRAWM